MIVCSCNVFSDAQVRAVLAQAARPPRMSRVYASLGCAAKCGRCARTVKRIIEEGENCAVAGGCGNACGTGNSVAC